MSNNDNAMARFLFAILQQKCLKDIDWNKVAHNPVLTQEITNGHAARMRYSRFRAAMLGLEPQRRNRTNPDKSRVSKKKKGDNVKPKKEEESGNENIKTEGPTDTNPNIKSERRGNTPPSQPPAQMMPTAAMVKTEPGLAHYAQRRHQQSILSAAAASPKIKQERPVMPITTPPMPEPSPFGIPNSAPAMTPTTAAYTDMHPRMQMRLLTPCSDSDVMQGFVSSHPHSPSANELLQHHHHQHQHQHQHHAQAQVHGHTHPHTHHISPPPSASASSPFDFSSPSPVQQQQHQQQCCDITNGGSPWQSQHHAQQHHEHHHTPSLGPGYPVAFSAAGGYGLDGGYAAAAAAAFCGDHHQQHQHPHQHQHHHHQQHEGEFRERELELQMDAMASSLGITTAGSQVVKHEEWEADGVYEGI